MADVANMTTSNQANDKCCPQNQDGGLLKSDTWLPHTCAPTHTQRKREGRRGRGRERDGGREREKEKGRGRELEGIQGLEELNRYLSKDDKLIAYLYPSLPLFLFSFIAFFLVTLPSLVYSI